MMGDESNAESRFLNRGDMIKFLYHDLAVSESSGIDKDKCVRIAGDIVGSIEDINAAELMWVCLCIAAHLVYILENVDDYTSDTVLAALKIVNKEPDRDNNSTGH